MVIVSDLWTVFSSGEEVVLRVRSGCLGTLRGELEQVYTVKGEDAGEWKAEADK